MQRWTLALLAFGTVLFVETVARAQQDVGDMQIGSRGDGRGALALALDRRTTVSTAFSDLLGTQATYTASDPGFAAATTDADVARLRGGTEVWVELLDTDGGRTALKVRDTLLVTPGERAVLGAAPDGLHHHPEIQLVLRAAPGVFGDGTLTFRLTTPSPHYAPSPAYALHVSNGFLPAVAIDTAGAAGALRCRRAIARAVRRVLARHDAVVPDCPAAAACGDTTGLPCRDGNDASGDPARLHAALAGARRAEREAAMARCGSQVEDVAVDAHLGMAACRADGLAVAAHRASTDEACGSAAAGATVGVLRRKVALADDCLRRVEGLAARQAAGLVASRGVVEVACAHASGVTPDGTTLLGRIQHTRRRARNAIRRACGDGAAPAALVGRAACDADELVSAAHAAAQDDLAAFPTRPSQGGAPLADHFPCLRAAPAHAHDHGH